MPLQEGSAGAGFPGVQESTPAVQVPVAAHAPTPQLVAKPSTVPSQLSSRLLQVSAEDDVSWTQTRLPLWQASVPSMQTPRRPVSHATPPPGLPSSVWPSQSSSSPLQISDPAGLMSSSPSSQSPPWEM